MMQKGSNTLLGVNTLRVEKRRRSLLWSGAEAGQLRICQSATAKLWGICCSHTASKPPADSRFLALLGMTMRTWHVSAKA